MGVTMNDYRNGPWGHRHDLTIGLEHERANSKWVFGYPGGRVYEDFEGTPQYVYLQDEDRTGATRIARRSSRKIRGPQVRESRWSLASG